MESSDLIWLVVIIVLVSFSAFFSSTETAFSSVSKIRLKNYANSGDLRAKRALKIAERYDTALSAVLIGNNIVNIGAASVGTLFFTRLLGGDAGAWVSTVVMTVLVLIFGEVVPKSLAKQHPENVAMATSGILWFLMKVFFPIIWLLQQFVKLFSRKGGEAQPTVTEEELKVMIEEIEDEGVLNEHESELVQSAIDFDDITADEVLVPRVDVTAVELNDSVEEIRELFFSSGHSRLPVYEKTIDNIVGILNEKDFLKSYLLDPAVDIQPLMQKVVYIPPKKRIAELLKELQRDRVHMAVVTDSYGGTIGIITMEDILEELVGEIWDESDEVKPEIELLSETKTDKGTVRTYRVCGDMNVYDFFEALEMDDDGYTGSSQSMSGWALDVFEKIPEEGDGYDFKNLHISVEILSEQRITSLIVTVSPQEDPEDEE